MVLKSDQVNLNRLYKSIDASACLSKWHELVSGPSDIGQDFWLGVATQAMVAAMHQHHNCPAGSIYVQKKPAVKVVVASAPSEKFVLTPYPAVVKKGKETNHIHLTIGTTSPVDFNLEKPDMSPLHTIEFWRMRRVWDKDYANMVISSVDVEYFLPKGVNGLPKSVVVKVPTAVPCKKIKKGHELVLHMPAKQRGYNTEKLLPVMQEPAQKKQRTVD